MTDSDVQTYLPRPTATRPLLGMTVLVVEDSRFASDAMRLLCLRSGRIISNTMNHVIASRTSADVIPITPAPVRPACR